MYCWPQQWQCTVRLCSYDHRIRLSMQPSVTTLISWIRCTQHDRVNLTRPQFNNSKCKVYTRTRLCLRMAYFSIHDAKYLDRDVSHTCARIYRRQRTLYTRPILPALFLRWAVWSDPLRLSDGRSKTSQIQSRTHSNYTTLVEWSLPQVNSCPDLSAGLAPKRSLATKLAS